MNCSKHIESQAIAKCKICGAGVCKECASKTALLKSDFGVLCPDCFNKKLDLLSDFYWEDKRKRKIRMIISIITYCLGIFFILGSIISHYYDMVLAIIIGVVLCGFYTGLTWRNVAQQAHEEEELRNGPTYVITEDGIEKEDAFWMKIVFFVIGTAIGVIYTPIRIIIDAIGISKDKRYLSEFATAKIK